MNKDCEQMLVSIKEYCKQHKYCDDCDYWTKNKRCIVSGSPANWEVGEDGHANNNQG